MTFIRTRSFRPDKPVVWPAYPGWPHQQINPLSASPIWDPNLVSTVRWCLSTLTLQWRHNERDCVSNHQPHDCLPNSLFKAQIKETSKLRVTGLCEGNSPVTGEFPAQRTSNAENVSIWWRHHEGIGRHSAGPKITHAFHEVSFVIFDFESSLLTRWRHSKWPTRSREISRYFKC